MYPVSLIMERIYQASKFETTSKKVDLAHQGIFHRLARIKETKNFLRQDSNISSAIYPCVRDRVILIRTWTGRCQPRVWILLLQNPIDDIKVSFCREPWAASLDAYLAPIPRQGQRECLLDRGVEIGSGAESNGEPSSKVYRLVPLQR